MDKHFTIGGEFEINSFPKASIKKSEKLNKYRSGVWTTNGRSALYLIIKKLADKNINHIHLPAFICDSIIQAVKKCQIDYSFYPINKNMSAIPDPPSNSAVLLIHYFGVINPTTKSLKDEFSNNLIEDASHVFLNENFLINNENQSVFFSARKFAPTVLGGWCNAHVELSHPDIDLEISLWKSLFARLLKGIYLGELDDKIIQSIENNYLNLFAESEQVHDAKIDPCYLPNIIINQIENIKWNSIAVKRRKNWNMLNELIGEKFDIMINHLPDGTVPIGYMIFFKDRDKIKEKLAKNRIFAPVHWPLPNEINKSDFPDSVHLSNSILTLPIDQRYGLDEMNYIAETIKKVA